MAGEVGVRVSLPETGGGVGIVPIPSPNADLYAILARSSKELFSEDFVHFFFLRTRVQANAAVSSPAISSCVLEPTLGFFVVFDSFYLGCFLLSDLKPPTENVDPIQR